MEQKRWYMCDPSKNTACKKRSCKYNPTAVYPVCDRTSNPAYAVLDEANRPRRQSMKKDWNVDIDSPEYKATRERRRNAIVYVLSALTVLISIANICLCLLRQ